MPRESGGLQSREARADLLFLFGHCARGIPGLAPGDGPRWRWFAAEQRFLKVRLAVGARRSRGAQKRRRVARRLKFPLARRGGRAEGRESNRWGRFLVGERAVAAALSPVRYHHVGNAKFEAMSRSSLSSAETRPSISATACMRTVATKRETRYPCKSRNVAIEAIVEAPGRGRDRSTSDSFVGQKRTASSAVLTLSRSARLPYSASACRSRAADSA